MKKRQAKKIHKRWLLLPPKKQPPWRKSTLNKALDYWLWKRFLPDRVSDRAW